MRLPWAEVLLEEQCFSSPLFLANRFKSTIFTLDMVTIIKKKSSTKENSRKFGKAILTRGIDTRKFCGVIKLSKDALIIPKELRDEWK